MEATATMKLDLTAIGQAARNARVSAKMTFRMMMQYCELSEKNIRQLEAGQYKGNIKYAQEQHELAVKTYLGNKNKHGSKTTILKEEKRQALMNELLKQAEKLSVIELKDLVKTVTVSNNKKRLMITF